MYGKDTAFIKIIQTLISSSASVSEPVLKERKRERGEGGGVKIEAKYTHSHCR